MNDMTMTSTARVKNAISAKPGPYTIETVLEVKHYTDRLFWFRITRPDAFRFRSGEFVMIGLPKEDGKPLLRAYSIASPFWDEALDFYSIKVADGPLTSRLQHIQPGDQVLLGRKPTGTLVLDALKPGKRLYMISTGTGIAPFASLIRDPETYEKFDQVILTHTCRESAELTYGNALVEAVKSDELIGEMAQEKLVHFASTTREDSPVKGRVTDLIESGELFGHLNVPPLDPAVDRVMICGSEGLLKDTRQICLDRGFIEGSNAAPADFVVEKAFVAT
ncbi:ferredoxin--NADP(+) reductase [Maricaulis virginensis]|uniref:ferredoxin--NADP(+) reductase n=2 Tax=Maricaulis virginensis TaxID=144022 RepID=A0A9W6MNB2_9PROT|nr:ferredoxin--NADP reductase [Maricaulis virginensis]GLK51883.1 ferredoxin--NADP(+) reductase [Maricaulis virginensis]